MAQGRQHKSYRLEQSTLELIEAYAEERGITQARAIEELVETASRAGEGGRDISRLEEHLADMRGTVDLLRGQLEEKDRQIAEKDKQLAAKDLQLESITAVASQAQALQAGEIHKQLRGDVLEAEGEEISPESTPEEEPAPPAPEVEPKSSEQAPKRKGFIARFFGL